jgi:lipopolysaccharide/colanic/teichoic acid biosynthesis glycosyltransferase
MTTKRLFDLIVSIPSLVALSPLMVVVAIWIKFDSAGPVIFRQERIGLGGTPFNILKFRTMTHGSERAESLLTSADDARITQCGKILRRFKIDELPQFLNVALGQMSIVGPRPEVRKYVELYPDDVRQRVLSVRPGITDNTAIRFRNENALLTGVEDKEREYVERILPIKLSMYESYVENQSLSGDLTLIFQTIGSVFKN